MPSERSADVKFEIGHVLFIDIVGYSKLLINEQSEQIQKLKEIVRGTEQVRLAEAEGKLLRLPTGDGGALVFRNSPEAPVLSALEISEELKNYPELRVRMGIHSGPVNEITDLNEQANIAGAGINTAQRVMDCGDAGHILVSQRVADDLSQYRQWSQRLHDLGECEVKHGVRLHLVNLYLGEVGNPALPERFRQAKETQTERATPASDSTSARRSRGLVSVLLILAAAGAGFYFVSHRPPAKAPPSSYVPVAPAIPQKSIAVLPFENLSEEKANAYFAEGIQDEILARLSKIADLKVISRTSTQRYKSTPENLPEIAKQLGVANILEGSVQRSGDAVRVTVQLIRALTDSHLWAETYDRKLIDTFGVESEVAQKIASSLKAKLTGSEQRAIAAQPTANPEAYQLYLKGRFFWNKRTGEDLKTALDYFQKAVAADPNYANAYAGEADACLLIPLFSAGTPKEYFPKAKAAAQHAIELDETSAEGHAALGQLLSFDLDFTGSEKEFQRAIELNPNYATAHHWYGNTLLANVGRFDEAVAEGKRAVELDPLSLIINADLGSTLMWGRRFDEAIAQQRRTLALDGNFYYAHWNLGEALYYKGDVAGAIAEYEKARSLEEDPETLGLLGQAYAKTGRKEEALKILAELNEVARRDYVRPELFAIIYIGLGDKSKAIQYLEDEYQRHDGFDFVGIRVDPRLDPLRDDPRFKQLLAKVVPM